ncbi:hypothetical protein CEXT_445911 [Caerostris extrusa]|uniref:Uncharacterized protein n=1 Tax=Caerostris extrusa TaxID=172846 RepID=A0AAV4US44_CAEEX|nr:hypothetical protein CEXT_445911 [Caerostris extrusa]
MRECPCQLEDIPLHRGLRKMSLAMDKGLIVYLSFGAQSVHLFFLSFIVFLSRLGWLTPRPDGRGPTMDIHTATPHGAYNEGGHRDRSGEP